jgi:hypothetical protein
VYLGWVRGSPARACPSLCSFQADPLELLSISSCRAWMLTLRAVQAGHVFVERLRGHLHRAAASTMNSAAMQV